ncbi:MAG: amidohydrolase [Candidatus Dormibacteraeota bacterium]|nr:amidohydrolase [Candidatus Dormibacteraeota bacterium]
MSGGKVLLAGCRPEIAAGADGRILATGARARAVAGRDALVLQLRGQAWPGLGDSHLHLEALALSRLGVDLSGARSREEALERVHRRARRLLPDGWLLGRGWYNDEWRDPRFPDRHGLDRAAAGRPVLLHRADGHSAWLSTAALRAAGITAGTPDPEGGVIDRGPDGGPTGILRESAIALAVGSVPEIPAAVYDKALIAALRDLARLGLTSVQSFDGSRSFTALQRLHAARRLPLRVTHHLPVAQLGEAERMGVRSGLGDDMLRVWGVKGFLDGSLGSRTAQMLDGSGVEVMPQDELEDAVRRCAGAGLNICLHAIGDRAVRRALDALLPHARARPDWRPRLEHAQFVHADDVPRFRAGGVIASMQPIHAVTDRPLTDSEWPHQAAHAHAWGALQRAGAVLAFGTDAPVESADPLACLHAATSWRREVGWHPEQALSERQALAAYTIGGAFAAGLERKVGRLAAGYLCDVTVVDSGRVTATIVGGRLVYGG